MTIWKGSDERILRAGDSCSTALTLGVGEGPGEAGEGECPIVPGGGTRAPQAEPVAGAQEGALTPPPLPRLHPPNQAQGQGAGQGAEGEEGHARGDREGEEDGGGIARVAGEGMEGCHPSAALRGLQ